MPVCITYQSNSSVLQSTRYRSSVIYRMQRARGVKREREGKSPFFNLDTATTVNGRCTRICARQICSWDTVIFHGTEEPRTKREICWENEPGSRLDYPVVGFSVKGRLLIFGTAKTFIAPIKWWIRTRERSCRVRMIRGGMYGMRLVDLIIAEQNLINEFFLSYTLFW